MSDPAERIAVVRALIAGEKSVAEGVAGVLNRLCKAAARALPAAGSGVSVMAQDGIREVAAASDSASQALEELQFTLGEGPCVDAFSSRRPVLEPDLAAGAGGRWPGYTPAACALGVRAVFVFPLAIGAAQLGVMDVYRQNPGILSQRALEQALTFADVAVQTLLDAQDSVPGGPGAEGLGNVLDSHYVVYQAQGMTMIDLGVSLVDAMARMRAYAYARDRLLRDVARDIVSGRLRLDADAS